MSSLTKVEDSLIPFTRNPSWDNLHKNLSKIGRINAPIGEVSLEVCFEPFHATSSKVVSSFAKVTLTSSETWESKIQKDRPIITFINESLVNDVLKLRDILQNLLDKGPLAFIETSLSISIKTFDHDRRPLRDLSIKGSFSANAYQNAFIGITSPSLRRLEAPKSEPNEQKKN